VQNRTMIGIALLTIAVMAPARAAMAQDDRLKKIEARLSALEERTAFALLGIGLFCGLWARNSGRDFWLWFVGGLVFNVFALITVAATSAEDEKAKKEAAKKAYKEALDL
jgi:hypothetical protein